MSDGHQRADGEQRALEFLDFLNRDEPDSTFKRSELQRATFDLFVKEGAEKGYAFTSDDLHSLLHPFTVFARIWNGGPHHP